MTTGGNITKNSKGWLGGFATESMGLGIAEMVSIGVSLGVVGIADQVAPSMLKGCSKAVGKILEPYLDNIENGLKKVCKLEECQPNLELPREQRAENLAKTMIVFSSAWALSMVAKIATRKVFNKLSDNNVGTKEIVKTGSKFKDFLNEYIIPDKHDRHVFYWDEGVHYGSLLLLNTGAAKYTDDMIKSTSNVLQKCGLSQKKANELAAMGIIWEVPNVLGWLAGAGRIAYHHYSHATHVEKLASGSALGSGTLHTPTP